MAGWWPRPGSNGLGFAPIIPDARALVADDDPHVQMMLETIYRPLPIVTLGKRTCRGRTGNCMGDRGLHPFLRNSHTGT